MKVNGDVLTIHQSDIKHFIMCADQFRAANGILPGGDIDPSVDGRVETDAATLGTVFHTVVEADLHERFVSDDDVRAFAEKELSALIAHYWTEGVEYRTESFGEGDKQLETLFKLTDRWFRSAERRGWQDLVAEEPDAIELEWSFDVPFMDRPDRKYAKVRLSGTADVLDRYNNRIVDWKTSSRKYERWEKQRWDVQPTVYTFAAATLGELQRGSEGYRFDFKVFNHRYNDDEPQTVEVWRDHGSWAWMVQQVEHMVTLIESDLERWPLRDDHALCSPKWCPVWADCKGQYVSHPSWR